MARDPSRQGCWVDLFNQTELRGTIRRLHGPREFVLAGDIRRIGSAIVGPAARLRILVGGKGADETIEIPAGAIAADLAAALARRSIRRIEIHQVVAKAPKTAGGPAKGNRSRKASP